MARTKVTTSRGVRGESGTGGKANVGLGKHTKSLIHQKANNGGKFSGRILKKRRYRPGTKALREIRYFQKDTSSLTAKAPLRRLLNEIVAKKGLYVHGKGGDQVFRMTEGAFNALQEIAESWVVDLHRNANMAAIHSGRVTVQRKDIRLAMNISGESTRLFGRNLRVTNIGRM